MKRGQPSDCDRYSARRRRRPGGARFCGGVALLMALSVPAVAALKAFDMPDVSAPAAVRIIETPPKSAQLMAAADRLERLSAERRQAAGSFINAEAAPAADAPDKTWTERARDAYERVVVPALSGAAEPDSTNAGQTAQTEPGKPQSDDAVVPPVKREMPVTPPAQDQPAAPAGDRPAATSPSSKPAQETPAAAAKDPATPEAPSVASPGLMDRVQDWLARSNRDYQGTIVKGLSTPSTAPAGGDDEIAKKIEDTKAAEARKAADEAAKKAQAEKAAEAAKAADAKAREQKQIEDARKKAEETKRLADEASKKADEILKLEVEKSKAATPAPAAPQKAETPKADDAERQRREAERQAEEMKRAEAARKAEAARQAEADRKAEDARAAEEARRRAEEAAQADKHRTRTVVLTPEPIVRPAATPTYGRPERSNGYRSPYVQDTAYRDAPVRQRLVIYSETRSGRIRGTAVKRWIWRTHAYSSRSCRYAGRRITPPARYTVARGDSLWRISAKHYNRGSKYPRIYRANRSIIHDPDLIYPCQRFKIPRRR